jgi:L-rhamnose mutarotase
MERVCFTARIRPDQLDDYRARHQAVWPGMTAALRAAGWANYSIFLSGDGLLVGYLETDDYAAALAAMEATSINERWQAQMSPFFADLAGQRPDEAFRRLPEIFHLD